MILSEYGYDSNYNRKQKNRVAIEVNELDEVLSTDGITCTYDTNGNLINKNTIQADISFTYDPLNRLIEAKKGDIKAEYIYDALGRRMSKKILSRGKEKDFEYYLYDGREEIGSYTRCIKPKQLRIPGLKNRGISNPIAIELGGTVYASVSDIQGNIRCLVTKKKSIFEKYSFGAFGEEDPKTTYKNPWRYASKRSDAETGLIYFGKRYYDPTLGKWLTIDPAGFHDSLNLYAYVLNNPFLYNDPDGQFVFAIPLLLWGAELALPAISACVVVYTAVTAVVAYEGYKAVQALNAKYNTSCCFWDLVTLDLLGEIVSKIKPKGKNPKDKKPDEPDKDEPQPPYPDPD